MLGAIAREINSAIYRLEKIAMKTVSCKDAMEAIMRQKDMTQEDLAGKLGLRPQSQGAISRSVRCSMSLKAAERYMAAMGYKVVFMPEEAELPEGSYALEDNRKYELDRYETKDMLTTAEVCDLIGVSRQNALREMRKSGCEMKRMKHTYVVDRESFVKYAKQRNGGRDEWIDGRTLRSIQGRV